MRALTLTAILAVLAAPAAAQGAANTAASAIPSASAQIAAAVLPLPESMRGSARVWGYGAGGAFAELRPGTGPMTCIADDPRDSRFHVACYHNSMEPYMARGRELRARGIAAVDSIRKADVAAGRIRMPSSASLFSITGSAASYDAATNTARGSKLFVIYVPFATTESMGLPATPVRGQPWIMHPGEPGAHVMFVPDMGN